MQRQGEAYRKERSVIRSEDDVGGKTINDKRWRIFMCAQKLANSQLNLPHGTKQKRLMKKLKIKTEMLRRNGPVIKLWSQS